MLTAGHNFGIRDCEPRFDESGELEGFCVIEHIDREVEDADEINTINAFFNWLGADATLIPDEEPEARIEALEKGLDRMRKCGKYGPRMKAMFRRVGKLLWRAENAEPYAANNRWFLAERDPVTKSISQQADELPYRWMQDVPDDIDAKCQQSLSYDLYETNDRGQVLRGYQWSRMLARKAAERAKRAEQLRHWAFHAPVETVRKYQGLARQRYNKSVQKCLYGAAMHNKKRTKLRNPHWHDLFLTKDQLEMVESAITLRLRAESARGDAEAIQMKWVPGHFEQCDDGVYRWEEAGWQLDKQAEKQPAPKKNWITNEVMIKASIKQILSDLTLPEDGMLNAPNFDFDGRPWTLARVIAAGDLGQEVGA
jgi:hypothetical protein